MEIDEEIKSSSSEEGDEDVSSEENKEESSSDSVEEEEDLPLSSDEENDEENDDQENVEPFDFDEEEGRGEPLELPHPKQILNGDKEDEYNQDSSDEEVLFFL